MSKQEPIYFFMPMRPPTVTAQERKVRVVSGKPVFYEPPEVREARALLVSALGQHRPESPRTGAISLTVAWLFPRGGTRHRNGEWRTTKPDTDNLQKLLKDCMTEVGFWKDDAQVCRELVLKYWADDPTGICIKIESLEGRCSE